MAGIESGDKVDGIVVVPEDSEEFLNQRQLEHYRQHRKQLIQWLTHLGKAEGYAHETARLRSYKIDRFFRWRWTQKESGYTLAVSEESADEYCKALLRRILKHLQGRGPKGAENSVQFLNHERNGDYDWEPQIKFSNGGSQNNRFDREYFS